MCARLDPIKQGETILDGYGYRQKFHVRSDEVKTQNIAIESMSNFFEVQIFLSHLL